MATASDTPTQTVQPAANAVLVDELKALLKLREAEEASAVAAHADVMRKIYEQDRQQIELAIKAVELGRDAGRRRHGRQTRPAATTRHSRRADESGEEGLTMNVTNRRVLLATLTAAPVAGAAPAVASAPEARDEVVEVTVALVRQALDLATKIQADLVGLDADLAERRAMYHRALAELDSVAEREAARKARRRVAAARRKAAAA